MAKGKTLDEGLSSDKGQLDALFAELQEVVGRHELARTRPDLLPDIQKRLVAMKEKLDPFVLGEKTLEQFPPLKDSLSTRLETISFTTFRERTPSKPPSAADMFDTRVTNVLDKNLWRELGDLVTVRNVEGEKKFHQIPIARLPGVAKKTDRQVQALLRSRFDFEGTLSPEEIEVFRSYKAERAIAKAEEAIRMLETREEQLSYWDYSKLLKILNAELEELATISVPNKLMKQFQEKLAEFKRRFGPSQL